MRADLREPANLLLADGCVVGERESEGSKGLDELQDARARLDGDGHGLLVDGDDLVEHREGDHALGVERGAVGGEGAADGAEPATVDVRPLHGCLELGEVLGLDVSRAGHFLGPTPVGDGLLLGGGFGELRGGVQGRLEEGEAGDGELDRGEERIEDGHGTPGAGGGAGGGGGEGVRALGHERARGEAQRVGALRMRHREGTATAGGQETRRGRQEVARGGGRETSARGRDRRPAQNTTGRQGRATCHPDRHRGATKSTTRTRKCGSSERAETTCASPQAVMRSIVVMIIAILTRE